MLVWVAVILKFHVVLKTEEQGVRESGNAWQHEIPRREVNVELLLWGLSKQKDSEGI